MKKLLILSILFVSSLNYSFSMNNCHSNCNSYNINYIESDEEVDLLPMTFEEVTSILTGSDGAVPSNIEEIYALYLNWQGQNRSCKVIDLRGIPFYAHTMATMLQEAEIARNHSAATNYKCWRCR